MNSNGGVSCSLPISALTGAGVAELIDEVRVGGTGGTKGQNFIWMVYMSVRLQIKYCRTLSNNYLNIRLLIVH